MSKILTLMLACCSLWLVTTSCSMFDFFSQEGGEYGTDMHVSVVITPGTDVVVGSGATRQFSASAREIPGNFPLNPQPTFVWSINPAHAAGTIDQNGLFTGPGTPGTYPGLVIATTTINGVNVSSGVDVIVTSNQDY